MPLNRNLSARDARAQNRALRGLGTQQNQSDGGGSEDEDHENPQEFESDEEIDDGDNDVGQDEEDEGSQEGDERGNTSGEDANGEGEGGDNTSNHNQEGDNDEEDIIEDEDPEPQRRKRKKRKETRRGENKRKRPIPVFRNDDEPRVRFSSDFVRELLEAQSRRQQPVIHVQPHHSLELKTPYSGGLDLDIYKRDFYTVMRHNKWQQDVATMKLRGNLTGTASKVVENRCREIGNGEVTVEELFALLDARCNNDEARINAKALYDGIRQRKDERIADFVERFERARMQAQMPDGPSAAMKFFRDLVYDVSNIPFNTKLFVNVQAVAESLAGLDLTATIRRRKSAPKDGDQSEEEPEVRFSSKLANEVKERSGRRKGLSNSERDDDEDGSAADEPKLQANKDVRALVQSLAVLSERVLPQLEAHSSKPFSHKGGSTFSGRLQDLPKASRDVRNEREDPDRDVRCQLCKVLGHEAIHCRNLRCMQCQRFGHSEVECTYAEACQKCGKMGHAARWCRSNIRCQTCGKLGHADNQCRFQQMPIQRTVPAQMPRPRPYPKQEGGACFKCGEQGHFARECVKDVRRTGSNAIPVSNPDRNNYQRRESEDRRGARGVHRMINNAGDDRQPRAKKEQEN